jgi:hypothetical protein
LVGKKDSIHQLIKYGIWLYLLLLVFEGALRKWILPGLSNPLLLIRDPLAIAIYALAYTKIPKSIVNPYTIPVFLVTGVSFMLTLVIGHGNIMVAAYGARVIALHFPMIFVIGYFLNREDIIFIGKIFLLVSIPMTLLLIAQFTSPQNAWVNRSPGGGFGMNITGALGKFRPPGTFSFITGVVQFYSIAAAFLLSAFFERRYFPFWLTIAVSGAVLIAIPVSISRTLFLNVGIILALSLYGVYRTGRTIKGLGRLALIAFLGLVVASQFEAFEVGVEAFQARWTNSTGEDQGGVQGAIVGRFMWELSRPFVNITKVKVFGEGLGLGTQVGSKLYTGERGFLMGEGEWERLTYEMGAIFGMVLIVYRCYFSFKLGSMAHKSLSSKNLLPWLLFSSSVLLLLNGQWGQPTTLGFTVVGAGFALAAMRRPNRKSPKRKIRHKPTEKSTKESVDNSTKSTEASKEVSEANEDIQLRSRKKFGSVIASLDAEQANNLSKPKHLKKPPPPPKKL